MEKEKLLIVEDDDDLRTQMKWGLGGDYTVFMAENRADALAIFKAEHPAIVTLDLGLPPQPAGVEEGFHALNDFLENDALAKVIVITARNEKQFALEAIGRGAYDFMTKPVDLEELNIIVKRAAHVARLECEHRDLEKNAATCGFEDMLGGSPQMEKVFEIIRRVAASEIPVLIVGESGTGKELAARAIHARSERCAGPFVPLNCGAIPETLLEAELFGHEKGAFTGAHIQRMGRIEKAHGGTLFLDEIGEVSTHLQSKLLRFLQDQKIERVGGREEIQVDVRVVAATNVDLNEAMQDGRFREDLYYRLGVVVISMPPLRERDGDLALISKAFLDRYSEESRKPGMSFSAPAFRAIERHGWPGNIRELENRIKRAIIMANGLKVTPADLELTSPYTKYDGHDLKSAREALEKDLISRAMARHNGNLTKVAGDLGISRPTLYDLINKLGMERK